MPQTLSSSASFPLSVLFLHLLQILPIRLRHILNPWPTLRACASSQPSLAIILLCGLHDGLAKILRGDVHGSVAVGVGNGRLRVAAAGGGGFAVEGGTAGAGEGGGGGA